MLDIDTGGLAFLTNVDMKRRQGKYEGSGKRYQMKRIWISLIAVGLLTIAAIAPVAGEEGTITVNLSEVDGSGVEGQARFVQHDDQTDVEVLITAGLVDEAVHAVGIYEGTCDDLGDAAFELEDIVDGVSESEVEADLADLMDGNHVIAVHAADDEDVTVACGEIEAAGVGGPAGDDDAVEDDDAAMDDEDDAAMDDEDDAAMDDEDDAAMDDEDDAAMDDEDDAAMDDEDDVAVDDEDDATVEEDATDDVEDEIVPAAGSIGGPSGDTLALLVALMAGSALGIGVLIRRQASRAPLRS
jgi:hypothetical protein